METVELVSMLVFLLVTLAICGVGMFVLLRRSPDQRRSISRLRELSEEDTPGSAIPDPPRKLGYSPIASALSEWFPMSEQASKELRTRMYRAGIFHGHFTEVFVGTKLLLLVALPLLLAWTPYTFGLLNIKFALLISLVAAVAGVWLPDIWLRHVTVQRQHELKRALPDTLDMLVLCLEGGESFMAAMLRVTDEVNLVYPLLGDELNIVQREIQLGLTAGQALKKFGERCGLAAVRDLASVLLQSERHGASVVQALRTHADAWRLERQQQAEEHAQKAAVKILFPTLLCIFPAIFVVLLGPAAHQLASLFTR